MAQDQAAVGAAAVENPIMAAYGQIPKSGYVGQGAVVDQLPQIGNREYFIGLANFMRMLVPGTRVTAQVGGYRPGYPEQVEGNLKDMVNPVQVRMSVTGADSPLPRHKPVELETPAYRIQSLFWLDQHPLPPQYEAIPIEEPLAPNPAYLTYDIVIASRYDFNPSLPQQEPPLIWWWGLQWNLIVGTAEDRDHYTVPLHDIRFIPPPAEAQHRLIAAPEAAGRRGRSRCPNCAIQGGTRYHKRRTRIASFRSSRKRTKTKRRRKRVHPRRSLRRKESRGKNSDLRKNKN